MHTPDAMIPDGGVYLLEWFGDLARDRSSGENGPQPITCSDILEWSSSTGHILRANEIDILQAMDAAYRQAWAVEAREMRDRGEG